jgi:hypothetical protein
MFVRYNAARRWYILLHRDLGRDLYLSVGSIVSDEIERDIINIYIYREREMEKKGIINVSVNPKYTLYVLWSTDAYGTYTLVYNNTGLPSAVHRYNTSEVADNLQLSERLNE